MTPKWGPFGGSPAQQKSSSRLDGKLILEVWPPPKTRSETDLQKEGLKNGGLGTMWQLGRATGVRSGIFGVLWGGSTKSLFDGFCRPGPRGCPRWVQEGSQGCPEPPKFRFLMIFCRFGVEFAVIFDTFIQVAGCGTQFGHGGGKAEGKWIYIY